jgi:hypothetical protein
VRELSRWPLLLAAVALLAAALGVDYVGSDRGYLLSAVLVGLAAAAFGAFVYAEGARHREWREDERGRDAVESPPRNAPPG